MTKFKFYMQCFGCKVSQYETESIREYWLKLGGEEISDYKQADLVYISTCAVTSNAVSDARQLYNKLLKIKAKVWFCGCAVSIGGFESVNNVNALAQNDKEKLIFADPFNSFEVSKVEISYPKFPKYKIENFNRTRPVIKIQDGCSQRCSYCIVPITRGISRSRAVSDILVEIEVLLQAGFREMVISGVNLYQYRYEKQDFWDIYKQIEDKFSEEYAGKARFKFSSLEPSQLNDKSIDIIRQSKMLCPHLHLSLQSGSPKILESMHRSAYNIQDILDYCNELKSIWGDFSLGADFLMGFNGEGDKELQETLYFVEKMPLTYAHIFPFSVRPQTEAENFEDALTQEQKNLHAKLVRDIISQKKQTFLEKILNKNSLKIALEKDNKGLCEYYITCRLDADFIKKDNELLVVKPVKIDNDELIVTTIV